MLDEVKVKDLLPPLAEWYKKNKRVLPWRKDRNPYHVWVSEIMLQQTRVEAVIPYYNRFLEALPTIGALASCEEDRLMKLWEGLGYYSRVRNMQKAARAIMESYGGRMPSDAAAIQRLPGIGPYTAGAIASIAFGLPCPAVDGNVLRIMARVSDDATDILSTPMKKAVTAVLTEAMEALADTPDSAEGKPALHRMEKSGADAQPSDSCSSPGAGAQPSAGRSIPGEINQAMMDLGACVCIPNGTPKCGECPWSGLCLARQRGTAEALPVRIKKTKRRVEERTVFVVTEGESVLLQKRPREGLLAGLYEFPNFPGWMDRKAAAEAIRQMGLEPVEIEPLADARHIFSHIEWRMKGYLIRVAASGTHHFVAKEALRTEYSVPSAFLAYSRLL